MYYCLHFQTGELSLFLKNFFKGDSCLSISRDLFTSVLGVLAAPNESAHREEREDALLEMIGAGGRDLFNPGELQRACQAVGFYRFSTFNSSKISKKILKLLRTGIN